MTMLPIPHHAADERPRTAAVLRGILEVDQLDDWLPDCVYFEDRKRYESQQIRHLDHILAADRHDFGEVAAIALPRAGGNTLPGAQLSLEQRCVLHIVAGAFAMRLRSARGAAPDVLRDKVFGFQFASSGPALFSTPGDELDLAVDQAIEASDGTLHLGDIVRFNANARVSRLDAVLRRLGLRGDDESRFLLGTFAAGAGALPSIDDAAAFLYNFYLYDVDRSLIEKRVNFVRYRDEYFVFDPRILPAISAALANIDMNWVVAQFDTRVLEGVMAQDVEQYMEAQGEDPQDNTITRPAAQLADGQLELACRCLGWTGSNCTDGYEYSYRYAAPDEALQLLWATKGPVADAVAILPGLRAAHRSRRSCSMVFAQAENPPKVFADHRAALGKGRQRLLTALQAATSAASSWQVCWTARLLSDLAPLSERETDALLTALRERHLDALAKAELRVALARSSSLTPDKIWDATRSTQPHVARSRALAASLLARRGHTAPWAMVHGELTTSDPLLARFLSTFDG